MVAFYAAVYPSVNETYFYLVMNRTVLIALNYHCHAHAGLDHKSGQTKLKKNLKHGLVFILIAENGWTFFQKSTHAFQALCAL